MSVMSLNEYVKYLTVQLWTYFTGEEKTKTEKSHTINNYWFGLFPFTLKLFIANKKR